MDIYRQITLFLDDTEHGLNLEPVSLEQYFQNARRWLQYRAEYENYESEYAEWDGRGRPGPPPMDRPQPPSVPKAEIEEVLSSVFIRRRRKDIAELYGDTAAIDGKAVRFPEPVLDNVAYRLDMVYARAGSLEEIEALLAQHAGARYRVTKYIEG